ncbi:hypothetical protein V500_05711 [Pseudogymnoascus sp. VKM F-4518 (FW-2643)]|nr:hypothetical protein V500_05711 [Pseudogymnoascus sp. VKM F-4518 (FW-2643)]
MSYSRGPPCTSGGSSAYRHEFDSFYEINYPQIQLAMKQHRCGVDIGFPLEAFQHLDARHGEAPRKVILSSVNAQIVSNEFLVRFQTWTLVPWNRSDTFIEELAKDCYLYSICAHDRIPGLRDEITLTNLIISRVRQLEAGENCQTRTFQCPYCYMDYMVDAKDLGEREFAVITTKWVNLDAGEESPDAKWRSHEDQYIDRRELDQTADHRRGIRADFENQAELSLEDLTADNERKLFSKRKRQGVTRAPDGCVWRWSGTTRWYLDPTKSNPSIWERWL